MNDPSVEMRSLGTDQQYHEQHLTAVQNDPTATEETGEKKCVALLSALEQTLLQLVIEWVIVVVVVVVVVVGLARGHVEGPWGPWRVCGGFIGPVGVWGPGSMLLHPWVECSVLHGSMNKSDMAGFHRFSVLLSFLSEVRHVETRPLRRMWSAIAVFVTSIWISYIFLIRGEELM